MGRDLVLKREGLFRATEVLERVEELRVAGGGGTREVSWNAGATIFGNKLAYLCACKSMLLDFLI